MLEIFAVHSVLKALEASGKNVCITWERLYLEPLTSTYSLAQIRPTGEFTDQLMTFRSNEIQNRRIEFGSEEDGWDRTRKA